jgi:transcriptional regulator with XRE-family HTH domain
VSSRRANPRRAPRSGLSRRFISQIERNIESPTLNTLFLICDTLDVTATNFISQWGPVR